MNNQNFYMRVLCLILIVGAAVFYNSNAREKEYSQEITELTERVDSLESQQEEMLTALQTWYDEQEEAAEEAKKAAEEAAKAAEEAAKAEEAAEAEEAAKAEEAAAAAEASGDSASEGTDAADGETADSEAAVAETDAENSSAESGAQDGTAQTESSDADNAYQDGTFTGEGDGYGGKIQVQITIEDDTLTDVQILSASGEDVAYLSLGKTVIDSVLAEQSTEVDTVSGATFSSTGILIAIEDALGKAENG